MVGTYNFKDVMRGDTIPSVGFTLTSVDRDSPVDLTNASITISFKKDRIGIKKTIGDGIVVSAPLSGYFSLEPFAFEHHGKYVYDIEVKFPDGVITTYLRGSIEVLQDVNI